MHRRNYEAIDYASRNGAAPEEPKTYESKRSLVRLGRFSARSMRVIALHAFLPSVSCRDHAADDAMAATEIVSPSRTLPATMISF